MKNPIDCSWFALDFFFLGTEGLAQGNLVEVAQAIKIMYWVTQSYQLIIWYHALHA